MTKTRESRTAYTVKLLPGFFVEDCGQEILEAAIVLPLLLLIMLAIFWFGRAFNVTSTLHRAAVQAVKTATQYTCAISCGNTSQANTQIVGSITTVLKADHLQIANLVAYTPGFPCTATPVPACTSLQNVQICTGVPLNCGTSSCQQPPVACGANASYGVRVSFAYSYSWPLVLANLPAMNLSAVAQSGPEQ